MSNTETAISNMDQCKEKMKDFFRAKEKVSYIRGHINSLNESIQFSKTLSRVFLCFSLSITVINYLTQSNLFSLTFGILLGMGLLGMGGVRLFSFYEKADLVEERKKFKQENTYYHDLVAYFYEEKNMAILFNYLLDKEKTYFVSFKTNTNEIKEAIEQMFLASKQEYFYMKEEALITLLKILRAEKQLEKRFETNQELQQLLNLSSENEEVKTPNLQPLNNNLVAKSLPATQYLYAK